MRFQENQFFNSYDSRHKILHILHKSCRRLGSNRLNSNNHRSEGFPNGCFKIALKMPPD